MRFPALVLLTLTLLCPALAAAQSTLNKCIDVKGMVTYTNKPCLNARKAETVEIDPAPVPDKPRVQPPLTAIPTPTQPESPAPASRPAPAAIKLETQRSPKKPVPDASSKRCDALSDKLGKALDAMDQARRKGYTLDQMNKWNEDIRELERKKQQAGCF